MFVNLIFIKAVKAGLSSIREELNCVCWLNYWISRKNYARHTQQ